MIKIKNIRKNIINILIKKFKNFSSTEVVVWPKLKNIKSKWGLINLII